MTVWLAGMKITADRLNDFTAEDDVTGIATAATNFSMNSSVGRKRAGITQVQIYVQYTGGGITATSGNITDTTCCTLNASYRPQEIITFNFDDGSEGGGGIINTDGTVVLRTAYGTIPTSRNLRISAEWISENG